MRRCLFLGDLAEENRDVSGLQASSNLYKVVQNPNSRKGSSLPHETYLQKVIPHRQSNICILMRRASAKVDVDRHEPTRP
jgi:hypothetical protein